MLSRSLEIQAAIDTEYKKLEAFDPEIRQGGVVIRPYHTPEQKAAIGLRIKLYEAECLKFRDFCEQLVAGIISGTGNASSNGVLSGDAYRQTLQAA